MSDIDQKKLVEEIRNANRTTMDVVKCIPHALKQWWSRTVTVTLLD